MGRMAQWLDGWTVLVRLHHSDIATYTAPIIAVLIAAGYLTEWPHEWTRIGARSVRRHPDGARNYNGRAVISEAVFWVGERQPGAIAGGW